MRPLSKKSYIVLYRRVWSIVMVFCFSDGPLTDEEAHGHRYKPGGTPFNAEITSAPCKSCFGCLWFSYQCFPLTTCCAQMHLRHKVLDGDMDKYLCFQGQFSCCCIHPGHCYENECPWLCLAAESACCNGLALSGSRMTVMDRYNLRSDPCERQLIRCTNCLNLLTCVCDFLAICNPRLRDFARILDAISSLVYHCVSGCMTSQVILELEYREGDKDVVVETGVVPESSGDYHSLIDKDAATSEK